MESGWDLPHKQNDMKELFLLLQNCPCDYRCIFCSRGSRRQQTQLENHCRRFDYREESLRIQHTIFNTYHRLDARSIKIGCNEPLNHPNISNIVEFSRRTGYKRVLIQTSGVRFSNYEFTKKIINAGLTHVDMPIYGSNGKTHDMIVRLKGSFNLIMKAIDNLKKFNINVKLHTLLLKQNLKEVHAIRKRFNNIVFRFPFPEPASPVDYEKYCARLSDIPVEIIKETELRIPCIQNNETSDRELQRRGEIRLKSGLSNKITRDEPHFEDKIKPLKCRNCKYFNRCDGIYPLYLEIYGDDEFNPRRPIIKAGGR